MFKLLSNREEKPPVLIPEALKPEEPVNYNSVLDYLVGLADKDYKKMTGSADIYREANKKVSKLTGFKDEPTTSIKNTEVTDEELDGMLSADPDELKAAFIADDQPATEPAKPYASSKKVKAD